MKTGFPGAFVISWPQTEVDGLSGAPTSALVTGAVWSWRGEMLRVDGPADVLQLDQANGAEDLRRRAARMVTRLVGKALDRPDGPDLDLRQVPLINSGFVVTDCEDLYTVTLIFTGPQNAPLLMFVGDIPPANTDLYIVETQFDLADRRGEDGEAGVICFTPGTQIETPDGPRLIEDLREGDKVQTRDSGAQDILWIGRKRMSGARLFVMPRLRPIRISKGALGVDRPGDQLIVSPDHQLLLEGPAAYDLFNEREVLVAAKHLVNDDTITIDNGRRHVTYIHMLLPRHEILMANGVPSESFHPTHADLDTLSPEDLTRLLGLYPNLKVAPDSYGDQTRRRLTAGEAAFLTHVA